ncbi:hypothetical protein E2C01_078796 [Portunus trituberculatus]|uniref:Uncharacterized protein n=1 Tax=Portunus trituberculatus TaxID=210409 RepID=A0A5B7IHS8_PORTR|nr:hypothetical protein [Portunus trituberculatus]
MEVNDRPYMSRDCRRGGACLLSDATRCWETLTLSSVTASFEGPRRPARDVDFGASLDSFPFGESRDQTNT